MKTNAITLLREKNFDCETNKFIQDIILDGYCVIPNSVSDAVLKKCSEDYFSFKNVAIKHYEASESGKYRRLVNLHCLVTSLADLFCKNEQALKVLDGLFHEPATLYTSLFYEIGSGQPLHRDTPYFWTNPPYQYFGVWVPLESVDEENGCLEVLTKSHLIQEEDRAAIGKIFYRDLNDIPPSDQRLWDYYQDRVLKRAEELGLVKKSVCVNAGDTIIWHPQTMHGGKEIVNNLRSRLSQAMHVTPRNVSVIHNQGFFNPKFEIKNKREWNYAISNNREYINHQSISFEHKGNLTVDQFKSLRGT